MIEERNSDYIGLVGEEHRKMYGQFFTHPKVAKFMVGWLMKSGSKKSIFDPGFGLGAFYDCVSRNKVTRFHGNEVDPCVLDYWKRHSKRKGASIQLKDYLTSWGATHENIVCNPPYARFQNFYNRHEISELFMQKLQVPLSGYTNIASMFLLKSIHELKKNGRLAYIMPLEFLNTGYGKVVKQKLIERGHLNSIIKLDCEKDVFPDAVTTVGIILYDTSRRHSHVNFFNVKSMEELGGVLDSAPDSRVNTESIDPHEKWMPYFLENTVSVRNDRVVQLGHYGGFHRGIATGANNFFAMSPSEARRRKIENYVIPCITKSSQIDIPIFENKQYDDLAKSDARVLLFSAEGKLSNGAVKYIRHGEQQCFHQRYLTKCRNPWYKMEYRDPSPILLNVFSRNKYKIVLNKSHAVNLTCYHGFQPNMFGKDYVEKLFLYLSSEIGRNVLSLSKRVYGSSLNKFEPNDLNGAFVPTPDIMDSISDKAVKIAVEQMKKHGTVPEAIEERFQSVSS